MFRSRSGEIPNPHQIKGGTTKVNTGDTIDAGNHQGLIVRKTDHSCGSVSAVIALSILGNWFQRLLLPVPVGPWGTFGYF